MRALLDVNGRRQLPGRVSKRFINARAWYSPARIERELGWWVQVSLAEGLRKMLG